MLQCYNVTGPERDSRSQSSQEHPVLTSQPLVKDQDVVHSISLSPAPGGLWSLQDLSSRQPF